MPSERTGERIRDVLRNIAAIENYTRGMAEADFRAHPMAVDAVERCLERIAAAARKLGDRFDAAAAPEGVDLPALRRFGSVLRHDYDAVDTAIVWTTVIRRIPDLKGFFTVLAGEFPAPEKDPDPDFDPFD